MRPPLKLVVLGALGLLCGCHAFRSWDARLVEAQQQLAQGHYREAIIDARNLLDAKPASAEAKLVVAEAELQLHDLQTAERDLQSAVRLGARSSVVVPLKIRLMLAQGKGQALLAAIDTNELKLPEPERSIRRGQALLLINDVAGAESAFRAALAVDPHAAEAHVGVAQAAVSRNNFEAALAELAHADQARPGLATSWQLRGSIYAHLGQWSAADAALEKANQLAATQLTLRQHVSLLASLEEVRLASGRIDAASSAQSQLQTLAGDTAIVQLMAARIAFARRDYPSAQNILQGIVAAAPTLFEARALLGNALLAQGQLNQAESQLAAAVQQAPQNSEVRSLLAQTQIKLGRVDEAIAQLQRYAQSNPDSAKAQLLLGDAYRAAHRDDEALIHYRAATEIDPGNAQYWLDLSRAQLASGQSRAAQESSQRALSVVQEARSRQLRDGRLAALEGDVRAALEQYAEASTAYDEALNLGGTVDIVIKDYQVRQRGKLPDPTAPLRQWLARNPKDGSLHALLGEAYQRAGRDDDAIREYQQAIAAGNSGVAVLNNLAWVYQKKGDARALPLARQVYEMAPKAPAVADTYGWTLLNQGQVAEGLKALEGAAGAAPDDEGIQLHYAAALARVGERRRARELLRSLLARKSTFEDRAQVEQLLTQL